jgi:signal transduction histidine kinase
MKHSPWGIQRRAVFLALAPAAIIAVVLTVYFLALRYEDVDTALHNRGESLVRQLAPAAEYGAFSGNRGELLRLVEAAAAEPDIAAVTIYDASSRPLASIGNRSLLGDLTNIPEGRLALMISSSVEVFHAVIRRPSLPFDDPFQGELSQARPAATPLGHVVAEFSRAPLEARKREILGVTLLTTLSVLVAALLLAYRLGRDITEPVLALEDAVARVHAGKLGVRVTPHASGTLTSLEAGFNEMAAALDAAQRRSASALAHSEAELARQLELTQAKKEEAERANADKSRFLAAASHDLRQPLHALDLFAAELSATVSGAPRQLVAQIVTAAGAMAEVLDALLEVSRLDLGAVEPRRRTVPLEPLLETIADAHRYSAKVKGLRLVYRPTALWVDTDPHLLRRMIDNLVANAVRYTRSGGVLLAARRRGERVRIDVWDTGIGIGADHLGYLFQEFYQVGNPERDAAKGLGLGLSIVARLGGILDHPVSVRSLPGRGSMFSLSVPLTKPAAVTEMPAVASSLPFRPLVAVRTDDLGRCCEICSLLDAWGYERECACSDDELPSLLAEHPAALICDAATLNQAVRNAIPPGRQPFLIVLGENGHAAADGLRIDGRLPTPPRPARLRALLHRLLEEDEEAEGANGVGEAPPATS